MRIVQEALNKAEEVNRESKESAEASKKVCQEAISRAETIGRETMEVVGTAVRALSEAMRSTQGTSILVRDTAQALAKAAREAIDAPARATKDKWMNS